MPLKYIKRQTFSSIDQLNPFREFVKLTMHSRLSVLIDHKAIGPVTADYLARLFMQSDSKFKI